MSLLMFEMPGDASVHKCQDDANYTMQRLQMTGRQWRVQMRTHASLGTCIRLAGTTWWNRNAKAWIPASQVLLWHIQHHAVLEHDRRAFCVYEVSTCKDEDACRWSGQHTCVP